MEKLQQYAIRTVRPEDLDQVAQMELSCFPAAEAADRESLSQRIGTFPESFFVAEGEGKLLGMINGCATDSRMICDEMFSDPSFHQPDGAYQAIFGLDVLPAYRHRGIAAGLMGHLIEDARKRGRKGSWNCRFQSLFCGTRRRLTCTVRKLSAGRSGSGKPSAFVR